MIRALPLLALLLAAPASAQIFSADDTNSPVHIDAGQIEVQSRADRAMITGGVKLTQGAMTLDADTVTVVYSRPATAEQPSPEINRVDANGHVVFTRGDQVASGHMAIYDIDRRIITLLGDVKLSQGGNHLAGARLAIDLTSGSSTLDGGPAAGVVGKGRVNATLLPKRTGP